MSKTITKEDALASGNAEDLAYLHQRGKISDAELAGAVGERESDVVKAITSAGGVDTPVAEKPNTGDANTVGHSIESHAQMVERMKAEQDVEDDEPIVAPGEYHSASNDLLRAEIARRNEGRSSEDKLSLDGKKADLIETLEADDAEGDEE